MRTKPLHLAAAVAIALSGSTVFAQTTGGTLRIAPGTTASSTTSTGTTSTTGTTANRTSAAQAGGCTGTGGSSCTATTSNDGATATGTTSGSTATTSSSNPGVTDSSFNPNFGSSLNPSVGAPGASTGSASGTNQTTVDPATTRPAPFSPGGAFGNPSGTATTTAPGTVPGNTVGNNFLPGTTGAVVLPDGSLQPQTTTQQNVVIQQPAQPQARAATPIFDEVAREGRAKERARRARGEEPRIIGIAPRTDVDRTHQMPDDPIIRY